MPFTGSHPAVVLPLFRWGLVPSALVIGSMVPDLPYFVPLPLGYGSTHSLLGVVSVDLLLGAVAFAVWHALLAPFLIAVAPAGVRERLGPAQPVGLVNHLRDWRRLPLLGLSLLIGAATHVGWDSLTHAGRSAPDHVSWLTTTDPGVHGYRWVQAANGVIGGAVIMAWLIRWWRTTPRLPGSAPHRPRASPQVARATWVIIGLATILGAGSGSLAALDGVGLNDSRRIAFLATTWGGGAAMIIAIICAVGWTSWTGWTSHQLRRALPRR